MKNIGIKSSTNNYINVLEDMMKAIHKLLPTSKLVSLHSFNLICTLNDVLLQYCRSTATCNLNLYIVKCYFDKYENSNDISRYFYGLMDSWKKNMDSGDCKLFASLLKEGRNDKNSVKFFIKIRRCILKTLNSKVLQQIHLTHEDAMAIVHTLFFDHESKQFIQKKLNELFINLKRKFINTAKIDGAVMAQFFLNCIQQKKTSQFDKIPIQKQPIQIKNICGIKKHRNLQINVIPAQNLSFSEQFADYYSKNEEDDMIQSILIDKQQIDEKNNQNLIQKNKRLNNKKDTQMNHTIPQGWQNYIRGNKLLKQKLLNSSDGYRGNDGFGKVY